MLILITSIKTQQGFSPRSTGLAQYCVYISLSSLVHSSLTGLPADLSGRINSLHHIKNHLIYTGKQIVQQTVPLLSLME